MRKAVDSNELFIDELEIPVADRIGEEGQGFRYLLHGLNPERILVAASALGAGETALQRASEYARTSRCAARPSRSSCAALACSNGNTRSTTTRIESSSRSWDASLQAQGLLRGTVGRI